MASRYGHLINRWTVAAVAALAVVAALLATTLTVGAQDRPPTIEDPTTVFFQDENNPNCYHHVQGNGSGSVEDDLLDSARSGC